MATTKQIEKMSGYPQSKEKLMCNLCEAVLNSKTAVWMELIEGTSNIIPAI